MQNMQVRVINKAEELPRMVCDNFFHSIEFFNMLLRTPGNTPYMVVVSDGGGRVVAHLLANIRRRGSFIFPFLYSQGRIYGEGEYAEDTDKEELFDLMLGAVTKLFARRLCFYIEFSNLGSKMFGYRFFRRHGYFPVRWMRIHNSHHSKSPEARVSEKMLQRIRSAYKSGVETSLASSEGDVSGFYRMLRNYYLLKFHRFIPRKHLFQEICSSGSGDIFITRHRGRIIGGCAVVYTGGDAFLWYIASQRKSHASVHPDLVTVWHALQSTYEKGCGHLHFMNVGLPFRKSAYREFILKFGGKPASSYRWFRFSIGWLNRLLNWIYRE